MQRKHLLTSRGFQFSSGLILRLLFWGQPADENCFEDEVYWEVSSADPQGQPHPYPSPLGILFLGRGAVSPAC